MLYEIIKRGVDIAAGITGILVFGVPMVIIAIVSRIESPGPVIFSQTRVGRGGRHFKMYKFASMITRTEEEEKEFLEKWQKENPELWAKYKANNFKLEDDPRITRVGRFIRKSSLDELPQFLNVLRGEMSLVGPRAYKPDELKHHRGEDLNSREDVDALLTAKPGITGLWQVSGRSKIDFGDRVKLDAGYARRRSLQEDVKIILKTPLVVFKGGGAY